MLTTIYDFWCRFIGRWTAIVPVSHSIDEETGDVFCGHSSSSCSLSSTSAYSNNYNNNNDKPKMCESPPLEWRTFDRINKMPESVIHQKDLFMDSKTDNTAKASTDTDNNNNKTLRTAKSPSSKSFDEKSEKSLN